MLKEYKSEAAPFFRQRLLQSLIIIQEFLLINNELHSYQKSQPYFLKAISTHHTILTENITYLIKKNPFPLFWIEFHSFSK